MPLVNAMLRHWRRASVRRGTPVRADVRLMKYGRTPAIVSSRLAPRWLSTVSADRTFCRSSIKLILFVVTFHSSPAKVYVRACVRACVRVLGREGRQMLKRGGLPSAHDTFKNC